MPYVVKLLPKYKNDPVIVSAMKEACHHNLYALANSSGMNGIGKDTIIKSTQPIVETMLGILSWVFGIVCVLAIVLFIIKKIRFRKSEAFTGYISAKKAFKASK